jgi:hypothetical protein
MVSSPGSPASSSCSWCGKVPGESMLVLRLHCISMLGINLKISMNEVPHP